jgi:hypothetical protein
MIALTCALIAGVPLAPPLLAQQTAGTGSSAPPERALSGVVIEKTSAHELIARWGPPVRVEEKNLGTLGQLTYVWQRAGVGLEALVFYTTRDGKRDETPIQQVEVFGNRAAPGGFGRTGCGVGLGDGIEKIRACYGAGYRQSQPEGDSERLRGVQVIEVQWGLDITLRMVLNSKGRIVSIRLRPWEF